MLAGSGCVVLLLPQPLGELGLRVPRHAQHAQVGPGTGARPPMRPVASQLVAPPVHRRDWAGTVQRWLRVLTFPRLTLRLR